MNRFEEILRHNNVSDKENAYNRLTALFICKLVDEIKKSETDIVEVQYKVGTDSYESLQDRLQRLHRDGMEQFMREDIFYVSDNYAEELVRQFTGQKRDKMIADLKSTLRRLKFYTNSDFAFKDVHNEELFYQNGKILVEVVQLFQQFRIIGSRDVQTLGDLFEQLLNKGFKQNEGQFFTPVPITRFIWDSLPLDRIMRGENETVFPKIVDYACGSGHFLTEGFEAVNAAFLRSEPEAENPPPWTKEGLYGIEKDYRLARVSKISLFMHGAGDGNIIFGDGLENEPDKGIAPGAFDILTANPPYAVHGFKPHLKLKRNHLETLSKISNTGSEIETLFAERIAQLLKPGGVAAVILPSAILNKENESFIAAREALLKNFYFRAVAQFGSKTFGATGTNTIILFLEKFREPPKRFDLVSDSVQAILEDRDLSGWEDREILDGYLRKIGISAEVYRRFLHRERTYSEWLDTAHFAAYVAAFESSAACANKRKQKAFSALPMTEQLAWYNSAFYDFALRVESEKLAYFGLSYSQSVLIITAPDGNKEQEAFLGYTWSNRKGQEGIQIKTPGGMLYCEADRIAGDTLAAVIRKSFEGTRVSVPNLAEYYRYETLSNLMDFTGSGFTKTLKTAPGRETRKKPGMVSYRLGDSELFSLSIGDRVLSSDMTPEGRYPVYSANVYEEFGRIDRQNLKDFSVPSVIWGIDGDWMVNYIPANQPFYPTDHCGVLRVKTPEVLSEYMALALQAEGEHERFSRSNRASVRRVGSLTVSVPPLEEQRRIADEIAELDCQIREQDNIVKDCEEAAKAKFTEMFGDPSNNIFSYPITTLKSVSKVPLSYGCVEAATTYDGRTRYIRITDIMENGTLGQDIKSAANSEEKYLLHDGDILFARSGATVGKTLRYRSDYGRAIYAGFLIRLIPNQDIIDPDYLFHFTRSDYYWNFVKSTQRVMAQPNINAREYGGLRILLPDIDLQKQYAAYVQTVDQTKREAVDRKSALVREREEKIRGYFHDESSVL